MAEVGWISAAPAILIALALLLGPGLAVLAPLRMGLVARVALAGPISIVTIGVAGMVFGPIGVTFAVWQPAVLALAAAGLVWLARRRLVAPPRDTAPPWPLAIAWAVSAVAIGVVAFAAVPSPNLVSQTYDNVFHLSAIASILDQGDASSLTLRTLIEPGRSFAFYPSGWHSLVVLIVQLTGAAIPVAVNAAWLAVSAAVWLPGVAWLTQACLPRTAPAAAAAVALPLGAAFGAMPYALLTWGTLYPTFLATALLPAAVAVPVLAWRGRRAVRPAVRARVVATAVVGVAVTAAAIAIGQPRVLATYALLLAIPVIGVIVTALVRGWRAGGRARRRVGVTLLGGAVAAVVVGAAAFWYLVTRLGLFERPLDDRLGGPQADAIQPIWVGGLQVLGQSWLTGAGTTATWPSLLLAAAIILGALVAVRRPRLRWLIASYLLIAVLFILAAGTDDVVTKLATALWYKDKYRLSSALPVLGVPLATLGILSAAAWARRRVSGSRRRLAVTGAWIVTITSAVSLAFSGMSSSIGAVFHLPETAARSAVVSRTQIAFFAALDETIPAGQRVLGDPWDGSAWTLVFGEREPVFPHVNGQWDADRQTLAWRLAEIDTDPEVCAALDRLRVRYVTYAPHVFGGGDPSGNHFPGPHAAVDAGLFTLVATDGDARLYRIDQCGDLD